MPDLVTYELYTRLFDSSLEMVAVPGDAYKIRVASILQSAIAAATANIADHEGRIAALEAAAAGAGDITAVTTSGTSGLSGGATSGAVALSIVRGTAANTTRHGNDAAYTDARTPTGSAGGQVGGTYPTSLDVRGLRETSGPTLLTLGSVADGEYLKRSGSTVIGGTPAGATPDPWPFYHAIYASPHADSDDFTSATINARWTVIKDTARTTPATPIGVVSGTAPGLLGGQFNMSPNYRGTYLAWQGTAGGVIRRVAVPPATLQLRFRCATAIDGTNGADCTLFVTAESGGAPDLTNNYAALGWTAAVAGELHHVAYGRSSGGGGFQINGPATYVPMTNVEFILVMVTAGAAVTFYWYMRTGPQSPTLINSRTINIGPGAPIYIYMRFTATADLFGTTTGGVISVCDYIRERDDWNLEAY